MASKKSKEPETPVSKSRFVDCPVCGKAVLEFKINEHLDRGCDIDSSQSSSENSSSSLLASPPPSSQPRFLRSPKSKTAGKRKREHHEDVKGSQSSQTQTSSKVMKSTPLAERMRPSELVQFVGQSDIMGQTGFMKQLLEDEVCDLPSLIFWGPPGVGKTSLGNLIAQKMKQRGGWKFVKMSAVSSGVAKVRNVIEQAASVLRLTNTRTILFLDEIHRFNKLQQDIFLPFVENGTLTLIGATTENPSFELNSALLSRCKVIVLKKLAQEEVVQILRSALQDKTRGVLLGQNEDVQISDKILEHMSLNADGDARAALNLLETVLRLARTQKRVSTNAPTSFTNSPPLQSTPCGRSSSGNSSSGGSSSGGSSPGNSSSGNSSSGGSSKKPQISGDNSSGPRVITVSHDHLKNALQRSHILFDKSGEQHYDLISALHKSIRGSDVHAALYWLGRMLEGGEKPLYVARRLIRASSEDIGLADPQALVQATTAYQACHMLGMPECNVILAQAVSYLALAPKSTAVYQAYQHVQDCIQNEPCEPVPLHLRNAPTKLMKELDYGREYKYNPDYNYDVPDQTYLPESLQGRKFFPKITPYQPPQSFQLLDMGVKKSSSLLKQL